VEIAMPREVEVTLKVSDARVLLRALKKLGARPDGHGSGRVHEMNDIFDTPQGGLAKHGQLLRIRTATPETAAKKAKRRGATRELGQRSVLTFKKAPADSPDATAARSPARHKVREEVEIELTDPGKLTQIFEGLGMKGWFRYEKYRTTYRLPRIAWAKGLLIELDETPIGTYVELEGPPEAIDRAALALGYSPRDYILKNYLVLYVEACRQSGREPSDMFFEPVK
jgi:adenylate cyclase class 2